MFGLSSRKSRLKPCHSNIAHDHPAEQIAAHTAHCSTIQDAAQMFVLFHDGNHTWSSAPPEWSHHRPCSFLMISTPGLVKRISFEIAF